MYITKTNNFNFLITLLSRNELKSMKKGESAVFLLSNLLYLLYLTKADQ